jgi:hypothetical protein
MTSPSGRKSRSMQREKHESVHGDSSYVVTTMARSGLTSDH